jgi:pyridoxal phosphate enzyme (YggS family)
VTDEHAIAARVAEVRERIAAAARRAGREPADVTLVAVTKTVDPDRVRTLVECGIHDIGENRAQEMVSKAAALVDLAPSWHFVGRLQSNKVRAIAPLAARIHSVDRHSLVGPLRDHAPHTPLLVQVNVAREPQKGGCAPEDAGALVDALRERGLRRVDGLMTVPPEGEDPRPVFDALRDLAAKLGLAHLSMGMTDDFEIAVEHGATIVRVGRALVGGRPRDGQDQRLG